MDPSECPTPHRPEGRRDEDERQEALVGLPAIALGEQETARVLKALERPCDWAVTRLADLRRRA